MSRWIAAGVAGTALAATAYYVWRRQEHGVEDADEPTSLEAIERILATADPEQIEMMREECIVVDDNDVPVRPGSKKECHIMSNIRDGLVHRAFSVFLFNRRGQLLLQKRSEAKITFPGYWANTCCSHPLWREEELEEKEHLGVKRAAQRKLVQELGIPAEDVPLECFTFLTRVHYSAASDDDVWGEHEIDHILVACPPADVRVEPNPNEVAETRYFDQAELSDWLEAADKTGTKVSPWFRIIAESMLPRWWAEVSALRSRQLAAGFAAPTDGAEALADFVDEDSIFRAGDFDATRGQQLPEGEGEEEEEVVGEASS